MVTRLANIIADFFACKNWIPKEEHDIYRYGCEVILSFLLNVMIVLVCGAFFHALVEASVFYVVFLTMRKFCGGYHATTYLRCNAIFTCNLLMVILLIKNAAFISNFFLSMAVVISILLVCTLSPIVNDNKPVRASSEKRYRRISIGLVFTFSAITFLLIPYHKNVSIIIALALLSVSIAMLAEKMKRIGDEMA
jgi:accessory gene regulator B